MKRLSIILIVSIIPLVSYAQFKNNAIKLNPFGLFAGQYQLGYERALNEKFSLQLSGGIISNTRKISTSSDGTTSSETKHKTLGFIAIPEARYYFKESLEGVYLGAFGRYRSTEIDVDKFTHSTNTTDLKKYTRNVIGGGLLAGYQLNTEGVVLDIFMGPQFKDVTTKQISGDEETFSFFGLFSSRRDSRVGVRFGVNLGYSF